MLVVRLKQHFRERQMEWALTGAAMGWGALLINSPQAFDRPFYHPLARMASPQVWGWSMFLLGTMGVAVLFINGAWRRTPVCRQIASVGRMFAWSGLLFGCLSFEVQTPAAMIYAMVLIMEGMALSNATADGLRTKPGAPADGH